MSKTQAQKQSTVEFYKKELNEANTVIVVHYLGLTVTEIEELRTKIRESGAKFKVTKNTLAKLAVEGTQYENIANYLTGPTALAYSDDPVGAAKAVVNFAKDNEKLVIVGGAANDDVLDVDRIKALAKLPSLDELRSKIISIINTPATRIAGVTQAPAGQIARVISAYSKKDS